MKTPIIAAIALAIPSLAVAGEWRMVGADHGREYGIDQETIREIGSRREFWVVAVELEPRTLADYTFDYSLRRMITDCSRDTIDVGQLSFFTKDNPSEPVYRTRTDPQPEYVMPDTIGYAMWRFVCEGAREHDLVFTTAQDFAQAVWGFRDALVALNEAVERAAEQAAEPID